MSKRDRSAFIATGVAAGFILGIGLALLFLVWAVPEFRNPVHEQIGQPYAQTPPPDSEQGNQAKLVYWGLLTLDDTLAQWVMAFFTIAATAVSLKAVFLVRDTLELNRKATDAAEISARAAFTSVRVTEETAQTQLRPYVFLNQIIDVALVDDATGQVPRRRIIAQWKNAGQTPAYRVTANFTYRLFEGAMPDDFDFKSASDKVHAGDMGPGQTSESSADIDVAIFNGAHLTPSRLYFYAWVEYEDNFLGSPRYRTETACEFVVKSMPNKKDMLKSYIYLDRFNGADQDCFRKPQPKKRQT